MGNNEITKVILDLEESYDLLEWKIEGVYVWQLTRVLVSDSLSNKKIIQNTPLLNPKSIFNKLKILYQRFIVNSIYLNPFIDLGSYHTAIIESDRKYLVDNEYIDIYTHYLVHDLIESKIEFKKYRFNHAIDRLSNSNYKTRHLDFIFFISRLCSFFIKIRFKSEDLERMRIIEDHFYSIFSIKVNLSFLFSQEIKRFKSQYFLFYWLFRRRKFQNLFLVNSCDKMPLIKAAKDNHIIVIELQHGLMARETLIQHYPNTKEDSLEYFPDKFYVWKDLGMITCKLPLSSQNIVQVENRHLQFVRNKYKDSRRKDNQILIISQPSVSKEIFSFVLNNIEEMNNFHFVYKLHPIEELDFYAKNPKSAYKKYENLLIADNNSSIYQLFSESAYVIGVFSAAVFEASFFGCKVFLLKLSGFEMALNLVETKKATMVDIDERLLNFLDE